MKILAFDGSPRKNGNSSLILKRFTETAEKLGAEVKIYKTDLLDIKPCRGCLMCNVLKKCAIRKDGWKWISSEIIAADVLAFSTPIYFHHTTASMKKLLDRFRSFIHVQITEEGIVHIPHQLWDKKIYLFTAHGSSSANDALPLVELFEFMTEIMGEKNKLKFINAVRLAVSGQISFNSEQLEQLYNKIGLPVKLVPTDLLKNAEWLDTAGRFAEELYV